MLLIVTTEILTFFFHHIQIGLCCHLSPDFICYKGHSLIVANVDELLGSKYLPDDHLLVDIVEIDRWVPAGGDWVFTALLVDT